MRKWQSYSAFQLAYESRVENRRGKYIIVYTRLPNVINSYKYYVSKFLILVKILNKLLLVMSLYDTSTLLYFRIIKENMVSKYKR
jgi:hypothetical protein